MSITAAGGAAKPVTAFEEKTETTHRWPQFLPDGRHFLYVSRGLSSTGGNEAGSLMLASLDDPAGTSLIEDATNAATSPPAIFSTGGPEACTRGGSTRRSGGSTESPRRSANKS